MIAFRAPLIWAVYALVTSVTQRTGDTRRSGQQPVGVHRILDERLARGDIDTEEYRRLRELLDGGTRPADTGNRSGR